jgi:hypothetical protein
MELTSGFAILKRYDVIFRQAIESRAFHRVGIVGPVYAIPLGNDPVPAPGAPRYRGLDRYPVPHMYPEMGEWFFSYMREDPELIEAARALGGIFIRIAGDDDLWMSRHWMETVEDARLVWNLMGKRNQNFEVIFARPWGDPSQFRSHAHSLVVMLRILFQEDFRALTMRCFFLNGTELILKAFSSPSTSYA